MRLGVDFGTTRIVVAVVDRGNYPVLSFETADGERCEWFPALAAVRGGEVLYGWEAWAGQEDPEATVVRSIKRWLAEAGPQTRVEIGGHEYALIDLLSGLCSALRTALGAAAGEPLEIMLGVPANANGNQRFLTAEAFRRAGFQVLGLLNEPTAASIEYGHALRGKTAMKDRILVYDLGGGTFDASLVEMEGNQHAVVASEGIPALGGDDFDDLLADLALAAAGVSEDSLSQGEVFRLHEECRRKKEALHANTRRVVVELDHVRDGLEAVTVPVADFYQRSEPLIEETLHAVEDLVAGEQGQLEALYVTGGGSELPQVGRMLKERFGRKVKRSAYARSATAIGLAIQADAQAGYRLSERFTRYFGVWREEEGGQRVVFDPLFVKGTPLPPAGEEPLKVTRSYCPAHNIGHFRYLECSRVSEDGRPAGEITMWDEILFPFEAGLALVERLEEVEVRRLEPSGEVEESYSCDASGAVTVTISHLSGGYERSYRLGRWAQRDQPVKPGRKRAKRSPAGRGK
ncbi:MAG: Hsp70 family protein [Acidimicrobiia bacterium]|nr:Hsp70 family protein [Acidimicrobiia bacterium]